MLDGQQMKEFESWMFKNICEKLRNKRFSEGWDDQFRQTIVLADLMKTYDRFNNEHVSFDYFEANKVTNIYNTIGRIVRW